MCLKKYPLIGRYGILIVSTVTSSRLFNCQSLGVTVGEYI